MENESQLIQEAVKALQAKDRNRARNILGRIIRDNPQNDKAWMYLAFAVDIPEQSLECLRRAVEINPANGKAKEMINRLEAKIQAQTAQSPPDSSKPTQESSKPTTKSQGRCNYPDGYWLRRRMRRGRWHPRLSSVGGFEGIEHRLSLFPSRGDVAADGAELLGSVNGAECA